MSKERGEELAIEYGIKFMETSAKASINVEEAFFTLARDIKCKMEKRLVNYFIFVIHSCSFGFFSPRFSRQYKKLFKYHVISTDLKKTLLFG